MQMLKIKQVKQGDYIKRKADAKTVFVRGEYDRTARAYLCHDVDDINRVILIKSEKPVFVGFTY